MKKTAILTLTLLLACTMSACSGSGNNQQDNSENLQYYMTESNEELQSKCEDKEQINTAEEIIDKAKTAFKTSIQDAENGDLGEFSMYCPDESVLSKSDKIDLTVEYLNTKQDGDSGYIWVKYNADYIDKQGETVQGAHDVLSRWEIKKENSEWKVTKITELI